MNKPNTMESVQPCSGQYSLKTDLRLNSWLAVSAVVYGVTGFLSHRHPEWSVPVRVTAALLPLVPMLFYVRSCVRFMRGLDELQRRVQQETWLFAALGTVFVGVIVSVLNANGVQSPNLEHGLGLVGAMCSMMLLWGVGSVIINRRYR
jgi:drug/metabolite transporter (DMT)-like permease